MKKIVVFDSPGIRFCEPLPNNWERVGLELKRQLIETGYEVFGDHECAPDPDKDIAIYIDALLRPAHPPMHKKSLYISLEPPVINKRFYDRILGWSYSRILTFSRQHVDNKRVFYSPYPVVRYGLRSEGERGDLCAITANKTSGHPAELYGARREIYRAMGKRLHLYGHGWDNSNLPDFVDYKGPCKHNYETYRGYKNAISIENQWLEGYASEKYWTPLQAGCDHLIRIGWNPDYSLSDCDEKGWSKGIVSHIQAIS